MDQGLAAVLGAGVGVLGTLGAASLTYVATRRQAVDHGRVAHWQSAHDERRSAYLALLEAAEPVATVVHSLPSRNEPDSSVVSAAVAEMNMAVPNLYTCAARVALAGPAELAAKAFDVHRTARNWRLFLFLLQREELAPEVYKERRGEVSQAFAAALRDFTGDARAVLQVPPSS